MYYINTNEKNFKNIKNGYHNPAWKDIDTQFAILLTEYNINTIDTITIYKYGKRITKQDRYDLDYEFKKIKEKHPENEINKFHLNKLLPIYILNYYTKNKYTGDKVALLNKFLKEIPITDPFIYSYQEYINSNMPKNLSPVLFNFDLIENYLIIESNYKNIKYYHYNKIITRINYMIPVEDENIKLQYKNISNKNRISYLIFYYITKYLEEDYRIIAYNIYKKYVPENVISKFKFNNPYREYTYTKYENKNNTPQNLKEKFKKFNFDFNIEGINYEDINNKPEKNHYNYYKKDKNNYNEYLYTNFKAKSKISHRRKPNNTKKFKYPKSKKDKININLQKGLNINNDYIFNNKFYLNKKDMYNKSEHNSKTIIRKSHSLGSIDEINRPKYLDVKNINQNKQHFDISKINSKIVKNTLDINNIENKQKNTINISENGEFRDGTDKRSNATNRNNKNKLNCNIKFLTCNKSEQGQIEDQNSNIKNTNTKLQSTNLNNASYTNYPFNLMGKTETASNLNEKVANKPLLNKAIINNNKYISNIHKENTFKLKNDDVAPCNNNNNLLTNNVIPNNTKTIENVSNVNQQNNLNININKNLTNENINPFKDIFNKIETKKKGDMISNKAKLTFNPTSNMQNKVEFQPNILENNFDVNNVRYNESDQNKNSSVNNNIITTENLFGIEEKNEYLTEIRTPFDNINSNKFENNFKNPFLDNNT